MNIVSVDKLTKWYAGKKLFENISFGIEHGQKTALIGVNGCGKSTLLKIISGKEIADSGEVTLRKGTRINFLEQVPEFEPEDSILDHVFKNDNPTINLIKKYEILCHKINTAYDDKLQDELTHLTQEIDRMDAWAYESEIKSVLSELGLNDLEIKMKTLSGGMLKKVALAQALLDDSELLILDEPTNHLDIDTINWMVGYLQRISKAVLLVTHDRFLVDKVCDSIYEISHNDLIKYVGNYTYYLEKKAELENMLVQEENRVKSVLRVELEWLKRGAKARSTKQKARIQRAHEMMNREKYKEDDSIEISITGRRLGKKILEVENISKSFGDKTVIKNFSYKFNQRERIGIVGPNGTGKTTFLKILTEQLAPDTGKIDKGINTFFGFFEQYNEILNEEMTILDFVKDSASMIKLSNGKMISASQMLERFLFVPNTHYTPIKKLSGGEKRRLYLLHLLMKNPNFLIFDEPTNDLDIKTISILEDFLDEFDGCLLLVSHDHYFMDRVADYLFIFDGTGNIDGFNGNYTDYLDYRKELLEEEKAKSQPKKNIQVKEESEKVKLTFKEKYELENLEKEIDKLEKEKAEVEKFFVSGEEDFNKITEWNNKYQVITQKLDEKMKRWEYLASFEV